MHPDNYLKSYERIEVPFLTKEMNDLFALRREEVQRAQQQSTNETI